MATRETLTDHQRVRAWAESRKARPACVKGTGGRNDAGTIRLDVPDYSGGDLLEEIGWDEWFVQFDANNLALVVQEQTADGQKSNFNTLVDRDGQ